MATMVAKMTKEELRQMIGSVVEEKLIELVGDPDEGRLIRVALRRRLARQLKAVARGERGKPLDDIVNRLGRV